MDKNTILKVGDQVVDKIGHHYEIVLLNSQHSFMVVAMYPVGTPAVYKPTGASFWMWRSDLRERV